MGSKDSTGHPRLFETTTQIVNQIPLADIYIIEEQLPIIKGTNSTNLKANVTLQEILSAIVTLLNVRQNDLSSLLPHDSNEKPLFKTANFVHFIKFNVIDEMFKLLVGGERVAIELKNIFKKHEAFQGIKFLCGFGTAMDEYHSTKLYTKYERELLGITLLMVAAFHTSMTATSSNKR